MNCREEVLSLQPMIPYKRFDISPPLTRGCSEGLDAFRFFFKIPSGNKPNQVRGQSSRLMLLLCYHTIAGCVLPLVRSGASL